MRIDHAIGSDARLHIGERRLEYRAFTGPASALPPLVLLHEGLGCVALWRDFPAQLVAAVGAPVFAYSRAGYGASSPCALPRPLDYMQREAEQVLMPVLDAMGVRDCVLVGHSDGASIAALCAARDDARRIRALVLMAPHFFTEEPGLQAIAQARVAFEKHDLRARLRKYHGDNVDCAFRGWSEAWLHADFRDWNITGCLARITVPVLAIQGEQDQYGSALQLQALRDRCPGPVDQLMLADCGHAPFTDQPLRTLAAIQGWMQRWFGAADEHAARAQTARQSPRDVCP